LNWPNALGLEGFGGDLLNMKQSTNQMDIARAAGVSVSTVSRALSNAPGIGDALRSRINRLALDLGYKSRGDKGALARPVRTYVTVNMITGDTVPFYSAIVEGLTQAARQAGLTLDVRLIHDRQFDPARLDRDAEDEDAGATMLVGMDLTTEFAARFAAGHKVVLVNTFDPAMRFDCVGPNNLYGGMLATRMLLDAGHRCLLHVREVLRPTTLQRHMGFEAAVAAAGARGTVIDTFGDPEKVLREAVRARKAGLTDWTGVYCVHDVSAIRMVHALEEAGLRVPGDISVVGFDDLPAAAMMVPRLTTVRIDCQAIGTQAIALIVRRMAEPDAVPLQVECGVMPVEGGTVAPVP
jgi:DNA-binding LacI/PurR family transcriptional regulator